MRKKFWWWIHDRLESAWHWVYRRKLARPRQTGRHGPGSIVDMSRSVFFVDRNGNICESDGSVAYVIGSPIPPAAVSFSQKMDPEKWYGSS